MPPKVINQKKRPWTKDHNKTFTWLHNYMKSKYDNVDKDNFIEMNKRELMSIIEKILHEVIVLWKACFL